MTQQAFIAQYESVRTVILANVATIRKLLDSASKLAELIERLSESADPGLKKQLEDQLKAMLDSMDKLVDQTMELFDAYNRFAEGAFRK